MNRELRLAIVFASLTLLWNLYGFAGNFFEHYWGGPGKPITFISYLANALLLAGLALVAVNQLPAARALALAGMVMAVWSLAGVATEVAVAAGKLPRGAGAPPLNLPEPSPLLGPLVPMISGAMTAALAWIASRRGAPNRHYAAAEWGAGAYCGLPRRKIQRGRAPCAAALTSAVRRRGRR